MSLYTNEMPIHIKEKCRQFPFVVTVSTDNPSSDHCYTVYSLRDNKISITRNMHSTLHFAKTERAISTEADVTISAVYCCSLFLLTITSMPYSRKTGTLTVSIEYHITQEISAEPYANRRIAQTARSSPWPTDLRKA
jgi:hypothetical protein